MGYLLPDLPQVWPLKQNAINYAVDYPLASKVITHKSYVDDGLHSADSISEAIILKLQLLDLPTEAEFLLWKRNSSNVKVLEHFSAKHRDPQIVNTAGKSIPRLAR